MGRQILIAGGGPVGVEAALYARRVGHEVRVFEGGELAASVRAWGFIRLFSPWRMNTTELGWSALAEAGVIGRAEAEARPTGHEFIERYLAPLASTPLLKGCFELHTRVVRVKREAGGFAVVVRDAKGAERIERADVVLDCTGTYTHHRWAGHGGVPAPGERELEKRIWYRLPDVLGSDRGRFADRHTLVLGAGYSAATVLSGIAELTKTHPRTRASWAIRRVGQAMQGIHNDPLPARAELTRASVRLADEPPAWLQYLGNCVLEKIEGGGGEPFAVSLKYGATNLVLTADEVVALVGYGPDTSLVEPLASEDVYTLGAKSYGTNGGFMLTTGHGQIPEAFRRMEGNARLDLYEG